MIKLRLSILIFLIVLMSPVFSYAQNDSLDVLIVHSLNSEKTALEALINDQNSDATISSILITQLDLISLTNYDFVIFSSSIEFSTDGAQELKLSEFAEGIDHTLMVLTPFVDEFDGDLRDNLGIEGITDIFPSEDDEYTDWTIQLNTKLGNETVGTTYDYSGKLGSVTLYPATNVIASAVSSTSTDPEIVEADFPLPVIFNATTDQGEIIVSTLSATDVTGGFLNQIPDFFTLLLQELVNRSFEPHKNNQAVATSGSNTISSTNPTDSQNTQPSSSDNNEISIPTVNIGFPVEYLILILILIGLLFIKKIFAVLRWFGEKILVAGVFIVGAFYNVQDRILDANDVFLNQSRVELLDYLEYLGAYGSHIRELKSLTNMGTGSLLWHLQVLEDFYFIHKFKISRNTIFVASEYVDEFDPNYKKTEMNIQSKYSNILLSDLVDLKDKHEISVNELEELSEVNNRTIRRFLQKLSQEGIVAYMQTNPIVIKITNRPLLEKLAKGIELRNTYTYRKSDVDIQTV